MIEIRHKQTDQVLLRVNADSLDGANLTGAKLAGANLAGSKINHACLRNIDLQGATLDGAQLIGSCLDGGNLNHATLQAADLTDASLQKTDLSRANLVEATLRYAHLSGANLLQARLTGANLSMADVRANLRGADLQSADLRGANLTGANLQQADLFQADLSGATITRAVLAGARTQGTKLVGVVNNETASRVEATTRASMIRRNPASVTGGFQMGGRVLVNCPFCNQQQEVPPQRVEHHSRCVTCKERFFVDRLGNARPPRKADPNQWTPEMSSITIPPPSSATWELPKKLTLPLLAVVALLLVGGGSWVALRSVTSPAYDLPDTLLGRAQFVGQAFAAGDTDRLLAVTLGETSHHVPNWLQKKRYPDWSRAVDAKAPVRVDARVLFEDTNNHRAGVITRIEVSAPPGTTQSMQAELITFWQQDDSGVWELDAESTTLGSLRPM